LLAFGGEMRSVTEVFNAGALAAVWRLEGPGFTDTGCVSKYAAISAIPSNDIKRRLNT
jgi:hypothetical protein